MWRYFLLFSIFLISCSEEESAPTDSGDSNEQGYSGISKLYACDQTSDKVHILDALTLEVLDEVSINFTDDMGDEEQPHFVIIDEINGYWFVTATQSGYVGMFDLETDTLISSIEVGNMPALLALDDITKTLYVSRMMSGMDMGDGMDMMMPSYKLNSLDYSGGSLNLLEDVCLAPTEDFLNFQTHMQYRLVILHQEMEVLYCQQALPQIG